MLEKWDDINGLVQRRINSSALAMELCLSCTEPSIYDKYLFNVTQCTKNSRQILSGYHGGGIDDRDGNDLSMYRWDWQGGMMNYWYDKHGLCNTAKHKACFFIMEHMAGLQFLTRTHTHTHIYIYITIIVKYLMNCGTLGIYHTMPLYLRIWE